MLEQKSPIPPVGDHFPMAYGRFWQIAGRTAMRLTGWKMVGVMPNEPKFIAVGGPHTKLRDTAIAIMIMLALGADCRIMVKSPAFDWPIVGRILRRVNCIPIDRDSPKGIIEQSVERLENDNFILCIAPEGTRTKVDTIKTGFYRIATASGLPILPIAFDLKGKRMNLLPMFYPSGDIDGEVETIRQMMNEMRLRQ